MAELRIGGLGKHAQEIQDGWMVVRSLVAFLVECETRAATGMPLRKRSIQRLKRITKNVHVDDWEDLQKEIIEQAVQLSNSIAGLYSEFQLDKRSLDEVEHGVRTLLRYAPGEDDRAVRRFIVSKEYIVKWGGAKRTAVRQVALHFRISEEVIFKLDDFYSQTPAASERDTTENLVRRTMIRAFGVSEDLAERAAVLVKANAEQRPVTESVESRTSQGPSVKAPAGAPCH